MMRASGMQDTLPSPNRGMPSLPSPAIPPSASSPTFRFHPHAHGSSPMTGPGGEGPGYFSVGSEVFGDWAAQAAASGGAMEGFEEQTPRGHPSGTFLPQDR